jgi:hypothetical protein
MDVNPMLCKFLFLFLLIIFFKARKTIWTDLGFGDFYNELAVIFYWVITLLDKNS